MPVLCCDTWLISAACYRLLTLLICCAPTPQLLPASHTADLLCTNSPQALEPSVQMVLQGFWLCWLTRSAVERQKLFAAN